VNCSWCEERFERLLDGLLNGAETARLRAHVDTCAACRSLLEELRVVDALLLEPRAVDLPPNFTFATMADVRTLPQPNVTPPPVAACLAAYLVAAWSLTGAAFLIAPSAVLAAGETARDGAATALGALGALAHVAVHIGDRANVGSWTLAAGIAAVDGLLLAGVAGMAVRLARPRSTQRLRG
jgi:anti-sigma factor RsiW